MHGRQQESIPVALVYLFCLLILVTLLQKRWFVPVGKPLLSRFPNREHQAGTKGGALLSRVWQPGQKVQPAPTWLAHPFVPVGVTNRDKRSLLFFHVFLFSILFLFQLYFCISIKLMYWNSVCMISTNIYIYIYSYLYNISPR